MIDCSKTENYLAEKRRMTKKHKLNGGAYICELNCTDCPLNSSNNGLSDMMSCSDFETIYPQKAIAIVQKWSDEHPKRTYLSEFLEHYPNAELNHGVPRTCLKKLGVVSGCAKTKKGDLYISCYRCWNQPIPIEDGEE